jgi:hypothetical protein
MEFIERAVRRSSRAQGGLARRALPRRAPPTGLPGGVIFQVDYHAADAVEQVAPQCARKEEPVVRGVEIAHAPEHVERTFLLVVHVSISVSGVDEVRVLWGTPSNLPGFALQTARRTLTPE